MAFLIISPSLEANTMPGPCKALGVEVTVGCWVSHITASKHPGPRMLKLPRKGNGQHFSDYTNIAKAGLCELPSAPVWMGSENLPVEGFPGEADAADLAL